MPMDQSSDRFARTGPAGSAEPEDAPPDPVAQWVAGRRLLAEKLPDWDLVPRDEMIVRRPSE